MSTGSEPETIWGRDRRVLLARATLGLVALGIGLRLARYLLNFPLWCDETMLASNLLGRGWSDVARPLDYCQVCPLGFLGLEWLAVSQFGFSEQILRMGPVLCALASVPLFGLLARRVLGAGSVGAVLAVGLFAVAQTPIRYSAEFKPYATDLLVAAVLMLLALRWREAPSRSRWLWVLAAFAPIAVAVSLPSMFILVAIAAVGLLDVAAARRTGVTTAYLAFLATAGIGVAGLAAMGQYHTTPGDREYFLNFWRKGFRRRGDSTRSCFTGWSRSTPDRFSRTRWSRPGGSNGRTWSCWRASLWDLPCWPDATPAPLPCSCCRSG